MPVAAAALTTLALGGAKVVTDQIIKAVSDHAIKGTGSAATARKRHAVASKVLKTLTSRAQDISQVKTLLCLDKPTLITEFYSQQFLTLHDESKVPAVFDELKDFSRLVITGVAGQGKSILFRYLSLEVLAKRELPIFVELRNYQHSDDLIELLTSELVALGFEDIPDILHLLFANVEVTVFLDAFDEIPDELQQKARKEIEDLARRFRGTRIFVSSRPTLEIQSSNHFEVARLAPLKKPAAIEALRKMCEERDDPDKITTELKKPVFREVAELLTTPLMVALLLLHYRLSQELPSTLLAFFGDLFEVLYKRHDQTKSYRRTRRSSASEVELRELFGYLSFATRSKGLVEAERLKFVELAEQGKEFHGRSFDSGSAVDDVIHGTNLLLHDGAMCRFAHKSIQEFYAARFLTMQSEDRIRKFCINRIKTWRTWRQFFEFFELLDREMFYKHFISTYVSWLAFDEYDRRITPDWNPSKKTYDKIAGKIMIGTDSSGVSIWFHDGQTLYFPGFSTAENQENHFVSKMAHAVAALDPSSYGVPEANIVDERLKLLSSGNAKAYTISDILDSPSAGPHCRTALKPIITSALQYVFGCYSFVDHRSSQNDLFS